MKVIECWAVYEWDGGERHNFEFHLATKEEAEKYKAKHKHDDVVPVVLTIFDSVEESEAHSHKALRKQAIAKLTPLERQALGIPQQEWESKE